MQPTRRDGPGLTERKDRLMALERYPDHAGRWRWRHVAGNGRTDNASEQGYRSKWYAGVKARLRYPGERLVDRDA